MIFLQLPAEQLALILFVLGLILLGFGAKTVMEKDVTTELNISFGSGKLQKRSLAMAMLVIGLLLEGIAIFHWFFLNP